MEKGRNMGAKEQRKIVLVDDMESVLRMVKEYLESYGFSVTAFNDPNAALHEINANNADTVLADFNMPVMDGFQLLSSIKASHPGIQCILMTGEPKDLPDIPFDCTVLDKTHDFLDNLIKAVSSCEQEK
jgi:CheY-like chemotaxis protein